MACKDDCCDSWLLAVRLATVGNLAATRVGNVLTANADGALSVDGTAPSVDDRILVKDQTTGADNGIYDVTATGSVTAPFVLTRSDDFYRSCNFTPPVVVAVSEGSANANTLWMLTTNATITLNSTALTWAKLGEPGTVERSLYNATANTSISNTTTETTLIGSGVGSLAIAANTITAAGNFRIRAAGLLTTGAAPGTLRIRANFGTVVVLDTTAIIPPINLSSRTWTLDALVEVGAPGGSMTISGEARFEFGTGVQSEVIAWEATILNATADSTISNTFNLTAQWGLAATTETITGEIFALSKVG